MSQLSTDVVYHILAFNANYNSDIPLINKDCSRIFNKKIYFNLVNKIQEWYISKSYSKTYNQLMEGNWNNVPKRALVKYYRKYYPNEYLLGYPEFMARKLHRNDLQEYINENMSPKETRRKIEVIKFLNLPDVSSLDITITGW